MEDSLSLLTGFKITKFFNKNQTTSKKFIVLNWELNLKIAQLEVDKRQFCHWLELIGMRNEINSEKNLDWAFFGWRRLSQLKLNLYSFIPSQDLEQLKTTTED